MMKKFTLLLGGAFILIMASCSTSSELNLLQRLQGSWMCVGENGNSLASDSVFAVEFNTDMSQSYARGTSDGDGGMGWLVNVNFNYQLQGDQLVVQSSSKSDSVVFMSATINYLSGATLIYTVDQYVINGVDQGDTSQYTFRNCNNPILFSVLPGLWGSPSSANRDILEIWGFGENNFLEYYQYNTQSETYTTAIKDGARFFIYGEFVITNFPATDSTPASYDVWVVQDIPRGQIHWYSRLANGSVMYDILSSMKDLP